MTRTVAESAALRGTVALPADKSIAHRAALFAALAEGTSVIANFPDSADPRSTLACLRQLGVDIAEEHPGRVVIRGQGREAFSTSGAAIDCGNSGTTMRLLSGILAGSRLGGTLVGDVSLSQRPMARITEPLRSMGAEIVLQGGHAPMQIRPGRPLHGITYTLPVASAQVKSCILLAGLYASGQTTIIEPVATRDHTERMLGLSIRRVGSARYITSSQTTRVKPFSVNLPRDFSAAAFFLVAGTIVGQGTVRLPGVGLNPTRTALLAVLRDMGADIRISGQTDAGGEPVGDLEIHPAALQGITVGGTIVANLIDELPILAIAAACARGRTVVTGAAELRVKECDRIHAVVQNLRALGADIEEFDDGFAIEGGAPLVGTTVDSFLDHRIAIAFGVAGLVAQGQTTITRADVAEVSYPDFWQALDRCVARS